MATPACDCDADKASLPAPDAVPISVMAAHPENCEDTSALAATVQLLISMLDNLAHPINCDAWLVGAAPPDPVILTLAAPTFADVNESLNISFMLEAFVPTFESVQLTDVPLGI